VGCVGTVDGVTVGVWVNSGGTVGVGLAVIVRYAACSGSSVGAIGAKVSQASEAQTIRQNMSEKRLTGSFFQCSCLDFPEHLTACTIRVMIFNPSMSYYTSPDLQTHVSQMNGDVRVLRSQTAEQKIFAIHWGLPFNL
jgi:hypothetical protein